MSDLAPPPDAVPVLDQEFKVQDACTLKVNIPGVYTRLRPSSDEARVSVHVAVAGVLEDLAEAVMNRLQLSTRQVQDTIQVQGATEPEATSWWRWLRTSTAVVYLDVRLPPQVKVEMDGSSGALDAAELTGSLDLTAAGGPVKIRKLNGSLTLHTQGSDVSLKEISGGQVAVQAAGGTVSLNSVTADRVSVRSASAPVTVQSGHGDLVVQSDGGPVTLRNQTGRCTAQANGAPLSFVGPLHAETWLTTVGAPLTVRLPQSCGAALNGTGAPLSIDDAFSLDGEREARRAVGTLNEGGPALRLEAIRGAVRCKGM